MYAVLTRLSSNIESTMDAKDSPCLHEQNRISNSTILNNNCFVVKWFVCMCTIFENGASNEAIVLQWLVWTASWDFKVVKQCKMLLFSVKEEEEEDILAIWQLSGLVLSWCFFIPLGVLFIMKTLEDEEYVIIKAYRFTVFEILLDFLYYHILCVRTIPTYRVYRLYNTPYFLECYICY